MMLDECMSKLARLQVVDVRLCSYQAYRIVETTYLEPQRLNELRGLAPPNNMGFLRVG